jgi:hypothetical protein
MFCASLSVAGERKCCVSVAYCHFERSRTKESQEELVGTPSSLYEASCHIAAT